MDKAFEQDLNHSKKPARDCKKEEFSCDNGEQCVHELHLWDGIFDCSDRSDERPDEDITSLIEVSIEKELYFNETEHAMKIRVSINVTYDEESDIDNKMDKNGKLMGYNVRIRPTSGSYEETPNRIPCERSFCKVEVEFIFRREEVYEVTVRPVTRSILTKIKDPNMEDQLDKTSLTKTMDSLKCKKGRSLVDMETDATMLCDFVRRPDITLTVNQVEVSKPIVYEEGTNLELGCEVVGGVPDKVDGFIWMIHSEPLMDTTKYQVDNASMENGAEILCKEETNGTMTCKNKEPHKIGRSAGKKVSHYEHKMDIKDDKKFISCIVNNQAFGGDFYHSSFIPIKVGANHKNGTGLHRSVHHNLLFRQVRIQSRQRWMSISRPKISRLKLGEIQFKRLITIQF